MTTAPTLSILTPLYRSRETVERCMASVDRSAVVAQVEVEHLLVLDGPDREVEALVSDRPSCLRVHRRLIRQAHAGIAAARNSALDAASGAVTTLLDADDEMTADRLALIGHGTLAAVLVGRQEVVAADGAEVPGRPPGRAEAHPHHLGSLVVPTSWLRGIGGFDEEYRLGDDWDVMIRLREAERPVQYRDEIFVRRHIGAHNASHDLHQLTADYVTGIRRHLGRRART